MSHQVEQLTLNGAMTLLSYLQCSQVSPTDLQVEAVAGILCEMLSQLENDFPGVTKEYGWERIATLTDSLTGKGINLDRDFAV